MCGITGFVNLTKDISKHQNIITNMNETIKKRGPDEDGYYYEKHVILGHKRLIVVDPNGGKQPMTTIHNNCQYTIVYNGQLYNTSDLRDELIENGFSFETYSDTEVLLKSYILWGCDVVKKLNGIFGFAIWDTRKQELFVARDHLGVKPFFYTIHDNTFVFSSEIKAILAYPGVEAKLDEQGISELFGLGPAHTPGVVAFKNIFELKPAEFGIFNSSGLHTEKYWSMVSKPHEDSLKTTCEKTKFLLEDSIQRQLVSDVPLCTFLSGGLDSSIITLYAANYYKNKKLGPLTTYSVDYKDNDKNIINVFNFA